MNGRTLYDVTHLLESTDGADERVRRVLELLDDLVPYEQCAMLVARLGHDPHIVLVPEQPFDIDEVCERLRRRHLERGRRFSIVVVAEGATPKDGELRSEFQSTDSFGHVRLGGIAIQLDTCADTVVVGDRRKIRQVVSSLVSNAVKFTPDRGKVGVALRRGPLVAHESGQGDIGPAIQLVVSDSGIGISRDQVAKIFEPFFQVDSSSTRAFGGTGLGLTLAKAYVEAHGGRIWVDTTPGQGSTFTATFPAIPPADGGQRGDGA